MIEPPSKTIRWSTQRTNVDEHLTPMLHDALCQRIHPHPKNKDQYPNACSFDWTFFGPDLWSQTPRAKYLEKTRRLIAALGLADARLAVAALVQGGTP